jgi:hypothetical protein
MIHIEFHVSFISRNVHVHMQNLYDVIWVVSQSPISARRTENVYINTPGNLEGLNRMLRRGKTCGRFRLRVAGGFLQGIGLLKAILQTS